MKKLILAAVMGVALNAAQATIYYNETFSYPDGNLTNSSGNLWITHSGTTQVGVTDGKAILSGANSADVHRDTGVAMGAGDVWYAGFDLTVSQVSGSIYFAHFLMGASTFGGKVMATTPSSGGDYRLGVSGISGTSVTNMWATDSDYGTTYRVVVSYNYDTGYSQLWIDPTQQSDTSLLSQGFATDEMTSFALRQATPANASTIDNLIVATTFNEALGVPEPSSVALSVLGGFALLGLRARRKSA
jgi:hypothetical protein